MKQNYESLQDLFILKIRSLYDIEAELVKALPKMADAATDMELKEAFTEHLTQTEEHVMRLEKVFELLDEEPTKVKVEAIRGLVEDAAWVIKNVKAENSNVTDSALISAASYVEHYEMAGYMAAVAWAEEMGKSEIAEILQQTLDEEMEADTKLMDIALDKINKKADAAVEVIA